MIIPLKWLSGLAGILLGLLTALGESPDILSTSRAIHSPLSAGTSISASYDGLTVLDSFAGLSQNPADPLIHTLRLLPWERANSVSISGDGNLLAVGSSLGVHLFGLPTLDEIRMIRTENWVRSVAISPDGTIVAGGVFDHAIHLWRASDGSLIRTLEGHSDWVRSVAFTRDGAILASASDDNTVRLWRVSDGMLLYSLADDTNGVRCIAFSPDDKVIAAGTADGRIHLWRVEDGTLLKSLEGHAGWVRTLAFSHDGMLLASGAFDATARIWRVADGTLLHELKGHTSSVLGAAFTPDDQLLATGSVDTTIRLWGVEDGQLRNILAGHTGFIYGIAISPDGAMLTSGSEDGTVRLWKISQLGPSGGTPPPGRSGDCRVCHHPPSPTIAPPVLEVSCEACHTGGAVLNWCPIFPRLTRIPFTTPGYTVSANNAGIPIPSGTLGVKIAAPGNGETFYVRPEFTAPLHVTGQVATRDLQISDIDVYLEAWSGAEKLGTLQTRLKTDGSFSFDLGINPDGGLPVRSSDQIDAGSIVCDNCHARYAPDLYLPQGELHLVVRAAGPGNESARDDRWVNLDVSTTEALEVTVVDASTGERVPEVSVQASTRLYEWRPRTSSGITSQDGVAALNLEILTRASTTYLVTVPRQVANGIYYEGRQDIEVTYPPGTSAKQSVVLKVRLQRGEINGKLEGQAKLSSEAVPVWAVSLPAGPAYRTEAAGGSFSFKELPVSEYIVFPGTASLLSGNFRDTIQTVDLNRSPVTDLTLAASLPRGEILKGNVLDSEAGWLPFAWLTLPGGEERPVDLADGTWMVDQDASEQKTMVVSAPGYFSQTVGLWPGTDPGNGSPVSLRRRPEMRSLAWGAGEVLIPPETDASFSETTLKVESGWVWGSGEDEQGLYIDTPEAGIRLSSGRFALARLPNRTAWFYLLEGSAEVHSRKLDEAILLGPGTMVALLGNDELAAMPYEPVLFTALNPSEDALFSPVWEPTPSAMLQKRLVELGLTAAQVVTYVTYALVLISIAAIPVAVLSLRIRRRNRPE